MIALATLHDLRQHLGLAAEDTADDERLLFALQAASAALERVTSRRLLPLYHTQTEVIDTRFPEQIALHDDLLEIISMLDGSETLLTAQIIRERDGTLRRTDDLPFSGDARAEIAISALWGYHPLPEFAWQSVTTLSAELAAAALTVSVNDTGSAAQPLFSPGQVLRVGDELLAVTAVDFVADTVTLRRGIQGTAAVVHASGSAVTSYSPAADLVRLCLRWAHWFYREADDPVATLPAGLLSSAASLSRIRV